MLKKIFSDAKFVWDLLMAWVDKIEATRISTGKTWRLHNLLAGAFWLTALLTLAALNAAHPMVWGLHKIYAWLYVALAVLTTLHQVIVYFRGHYFWQPKIIRY